MPIKTPKNYCIVRVEDKPVRKQTEVDTAILSWLHRMTNLETDGKAHRELVSIVNGLVDASRVESREELVMAEMELALERNKLDLIRGVTQSANYVDTNGRTTSYGAFRRKWRKAYHLPKHPLDNIAKEAAGKSL